MRVGETLGLRDSERLAVPDTEPEGVGDAEREPDALAERLADADREGAWLLDPDRDAEPEPLCVPVGEGAPLGEPVGLLEGVALGDRLKVSVGVRVQLAVADPEGGLAEADGLGLGRVLVPVGLRVGVVEGVWVWLTPMDKVPVVVMEMLPEADRERVPEPLAWPVAVRAVPEREGLRVAVPVWLREGGLMVHEGLGVPETERVGEGLGEKVREKETVRVPVRVA